MRSSSSPYHLLHLRHRQLQLQLPLQLQSHQRLCRKHLSRVHHVAHPHQQSPHLFDHRINLVPVLAACHDPPCAVPVLGASSLDHGPMLCRRVCRGICPPFRVPCSLGLRSTCLLHSRDGSYGGLLEIGSGVCVRVRVLCHDHGRGSRRGRSGMSAWVVSGETVQGGKMDGTHVVVSGRSMSVAVYWR